MRWSTLFYNLLVAFLWEFLFWPFAAFARYLDFKDGMPVYAEKFRWASTLGMGMLVAGILLCFLLASWVREATMILLLGIYLEGFIRYFRLLRRTSGAGGIALGNRG